MASTGHTCIAAPGFISRAGKGFGPSTHMAMISEDAIVLAIAEARSGVTGGVVSGVIGGVITGETVGVTAGVIPGATPLLGAVSGDRQFFAGS
jgi:hypothetical protein